MRIELTISGPGGQRDVAVVGEPGLVLGDVRARLASVAGEATGAAMWSGPRQLGPADRIGDDGLRTGAVIEIGPDGEPVRAAVGGPSLQVVGGPDAGYSKPLTQGRLTIGRAGGCDFVLADDRASRRHAELEVTATGVLLRDLGSANGTTVDGVPVGPEGRLVDSGAVVGIGDTLVVVRELDMLPAALVPGDGPVLVNRSPRHLRPLPAPEIVSGGTGSAVGPISGRVPWLAALVPAAFGVGVAVITGSSTFLLFALLSPVLLLSSALGDRGQRRRTRLRSASADRSAQADLRRHLGRALAGESAERRVRAPDPALLWRVATTPGSRLWERRRDDPDHLGIRLGPADLESATQVRNGSQVHPAGMLRAVPYVVDLRQGPLGLTGPDDVIVGLARWVVAQLVVLQSPSDVQVVLLLSGDTEAAWSWARWLPHLRAVGTSAAEWQHVVGELADEISRRSGRPSAPAGWDGLWLVLVLDRAGSVADVTGLAAVLARGRAYGVAALSVDRYPAALPTSTRITVRVDDDAGSRAEVRAGDRSSTVVLDRVPVAYAEQVARALAPLVDAGDDVFAGLPTSVPLTSLLGLERQSAHDIARRWASASGGADTRLGRAADGPVRIDLASDGPHALVAGTTGSGKSELLRSWVTGLAATHPPDALTFLLVDYKGGAAFADCGRLPHCVGLVTDLDVALTRRALVSFEAELRQRERTFAAAGAADLVEYRASGGVGVPRLVIVVDEFAALADELPEFVRGLIGVAQRGRSLGVHLVLATQRPGAAVTADIRANTSLRIALRVTDPAESLDVIDSPDAAAIDRLHPGRAYLRTGDRVIPFQTASSAHPTGPATGVEVLDTWRRPQARAGPADSGGLGRLVEAIGEAATLTARSAGPSLWHAPLPTTLSRTAVRAVPDTATAIALGLVDLPAERAQPGLTLDLADGRSTLLVGGPGSGRTSALATLAIGAAGRLGPLDLQIHVIDTGPLSHRLNVLPQAASLVTSAEPGSISTLLTRLRAATARRGPGEGHLLLLVDDWDAVLDTGDDADRGAWSDALAGLLRIGRRARLTVVTAGGRSLLAARSSAAYDARWLLPLVDPADYPLAGVAARDVPRTLPAGRGIRTADGAHFQLTAPDDLPRLAAEAARVWADAPHPQTAVRVTALPRSVPRTSLPLGDHLALGALGDSARPFALDPHGSSRLLVAGPPRSGRSTLLRVLASEGRRLGLPVVVAAAPGSPLAAMDVDDLLRVIGPGDPDDLGPPPLRPTLLLVDDAETFVDRPVGDALGTWLRAPGTPLFAVVVARTDEAATTYRGPAAEVRRGHCGVLLRPTFVDGDLLGVRLDRRALGGPPGRGVIVGPRSWGPEFTDGDPVAIQVAEP